MGGNPLKQVANIGGSIMTMGQKNNIYGGGSPISSKLDEKVKLPMFNGQTSNSGGLSMQNGVSTYIPIGDQIIKISDADIKNMSDKRGTELEAIRAKEGLSNANRSQLFSPMPMPQLNNPSSVKGGSHNTSAKGAH